ncbi:hypothetical protein BDR26DRAFT_867066 [Obelidium mucronatum]|nr:hypothetical protein BDR26DRAFT_867066 [Obelidium mucronatum]
MSSLFDFSHILHTANPGSASSSPPLPINNQSLQDEIDRFLLEASTSELDQSSGNTSPTSGVGLGSTPLFGNSPFDFLFTFGSGSTSSAPSSQPFAPASPSESDSSLSKSQPAGKSTRGRKPKVLSEGEVSCFSVLPQLSLDRREALPFDGSLHDTLLLPSCFPVLMFYARCC